MLETLQNIDTELFLALNSLRCELIDHFVLAFSGRWIWVLMYAVIAWMLMRRYGWRRGLIFVLLTGLAVGCADFICASVIRPYVQRLRPANLENAISGMVSIVDGYRGGRYGFPSCHAANTICLATLSALLMRKRSYTIFIFVWAVLQCYSRIYLGVHYPGDLLVGAAAGALVAFVAYQATAGIYARIHPDEPLIVPEREVSIYPLLVVALAILILLMF